MSEEKPVEPSEQSAPAAEKKAVMSERVEVVLKKPHTHGGGFYAAGEKITVSKDEADFMQQVGVI